MDGQEMVSTAFKNQSLDKNVFYPNTFNSGNGYGFKTIFKFSD
jgi:hypothetical protein